MKKVILVFGIILTSVIAAWSLNKKEATVNYTPQVKVERPVAQTNTFGANLNNIANAD